MIAQNAGGSTSYYVYNAHGDTTRLLNSSGSVVRTYDNDSFGNSIMNSGTGATTPFRYNGQYTDIDTGLIYLRNRCYDPTTGRFTQEDPAKDGLNWYVYCANDPVNMVDPWGTTMTLLGEGGDVRRIFDNIQSLTDDELVLQELDFTINGEQAYGVQILAYHDGSKSVGTELIRRIRNNSDYDVKLHFDINLDNAGDYNGCTYFENYDNASMYYYEYNVPHSDKGSGSEIVFSYKTPSVVVFNDNNDEFDEYAVEEMPLNILIGHELIHALRGMDGNFKSNYFRDYKAGVNYEEYEVTGISYYDSNGNYVDCYHWRMNENALRREQRNWRRVEY